MIADDGVAMHLPATYRIRVDGALPVGWPDELPEMRLVECRGAGTILEATVADQPALLGVIVRLEDMGCRVRDLYVVWALSKVPGGL